MDGLRPATTGLGPLGRELERHVEVGGFDDPEAPDDLLGLGVGAVGHHRRLTLAVDDGRRRRRLKPPGEDPVTVNVKLVIEGAGRGERLLHLLLGAVVAELVSRRDRARSTGSASSHFSSVPGGPDDHLLPPPRTASRRYDNLPQKASNRICSRAHCPFDALSQEHRTLECRVSPAGHFSSRPVGSGAARSWRGHERVAPGEPPRNQGSTCPRTQIPTRTTPSASTRPPSDSRFLEARRCRGRRRQSPRPSSRRSTVATDSRGATAFGPHRRDPHSDRTPRPDVQRSADGNRVRSRASRRV